MDQLLVIPTDGAEFEEESDGYEEDEDVPKGREEEEEGEVFGWDAEGEVTGAVISLPVHRTRLLGEFRKRRRTHRSSHSEQQGNTVEKSGNTEVKYGNTEVKYGNTEVKYGNAGEKSGNVEKGSTERSEPVGKGARQECSAGDANGLGYRGNGNAAQEIGNRAQKNSYKLQENLEVAQKEGDRDIIDVRRIGQVVVKHMDTGKENAGAVHKRGSVAHVNNHAHGNVTNKHGCHQAKHIVAVRKHHNAAGRHSNHARKSMGSAKHRHGRVVRRHGNVASPKRFCRCDGNHESDLLSEANLSDPGSVATSAQVRKRALSESDFETCLEDMESCKCDRRLSDGMATALEDIDTDAYVLDNSDYLSCLEDSLEKKVNGILSGCSFLEVPGRSRCLEGRLISTRRRSSGSENAGVVLEELESYKLELLAWGNRSEVSERRLIVRRSSATLADEDGILDIGMSRRSSDCTTLVGSATSTDGVWTNKIAHQDKISASATANLDNGTPTRYSIPGSCSRDCTTLGDTTATDGVAVVTIEGAEQGDQSFEECSESSMFIRKDSFSLKSRMAVVHRQSSRVEKSYGASTVGSDADSPSWMRSARGQKSVSTEHDSGSGSKLAVISRRDSQTSGFCSDFAGGASDYSVNDRRDDSGWIGYVDSDVMTDDVTWADLYNVAELRDPLRRGRSDHVLSDGREKRGERETENRAEVGSTEVMKGTVRKEGIGRGGGRGGERFGNAGGTSKLGKPTEIASPLPAKNSEVGRTVRSGRGADISRSSCVVGPESNPAPSTSNEMSSSSSEFGDVSVPKFGSPVKTTPKLERHFSFELEEGCLVLSENSPVTSDQALPQPPVAKEKPVKPLRKNLPKVGNTGGSPSLKRRVPTPSVAGGINSIFTEPGKSTNVFGTVGKKPAKVVKIGGQAEVKTGNSGRAGERKSGNVGLGTEAKNGSVAERRSGNCAPGAGSKNGNVGNVVKSRFGNAVAKSGISPANLGIKSAKIGHLSSNANLKPGNAGSKSGRVVAIKSGISASDKSGNEESLRSSKVETVANISLVDSGSELETKYGNAEPKSGNDALDDVRSDPIPCANETSDEFRNPTNIPQDVGSPGNELHGGASLENRTSPASPDNCDTPSIAGTYLPPLLQAGYPPRLNSAQRIDHIIPPTITRSLFATDPVPPARLVSQDSGIDTRESFEGSRNMFPEHFSIGSHESEVTRRSLTLVNDFGDASEDIGLERLPGLYDHRLREDLPGSSDPGACPYSAKYNLEGEFGDVTDDLGVGRFLSVPTEGSVASDASGHSYGVYANHFEEGVGVVRRRRSTPEDDLFPDGAVGNLEFPGASADSGLFIEEDNYVFDEVYDTCNEGDEEEFALNEELMMEVLCANRVNQMTRTYDDVEAMRRLLEEKEKDLELTARIGKELLERNQQLKVQVQALDVDIRNAHESNTQLRHELQQKTQILHALTSDEDGSHLEAYSPLASPTSGKPPPALVGPLGLHEGKMSARESVARLKRKVDLLEKENKSLRVEATKLASETQLAEETEAKLVEGVAQQLASVGEETRLLSDELERVRGEERRYREEVERLMEQLALAQAEIRNLKEENAELSKLVRFTTETQEKLTTELADFKEQYHEVSCLLREAQENLRKVRQKALPSALTGSHYLSLPITRHHGYYNNHPGDSIASELEISMISEMSLDSGIHMPEAQGRIPHYRKVFETYRSASRSSNSPSPSPLHRMPSNTSLQGTSSSFAQLSTTATLSASSMQTCRMSSKPAVSTGTSGSAGYRSSYSTEVPKHLYGGLPSTGFFSFDSAGQSEESDQSGMATDNEDCLYPTTTTSGRIRDGIPGSPGAKELQAALCRLDKERQPMLTKGEKAIGGYEGKSKASSMDVGPHRWSMSSSSASVCHALPYGCRTPDSIMSTGSSRGSRSSWRIPERLMIMKVREGSQFLDEWSRLATPSLSAALEERPGVKVRGRMNDGIQQHTLMDFEEDDLMSAASEKSSSKTLEPIHPGKFFQSTASVYTFTNSTVLHPDNISGVAPSPIPQSPAPSTPTQQPTPLLSRRSSMSAGTPTFSTALGLAKMLHERGISASSSENDLSVKGHFTSATVTPCNSPDESPFSSRSPSPEEEDANPIASLISSGAELLRRSLGGGTGSGQQRTARGRAIRRNSRPPIGSLSRSDRKALAGMKLVEKLERIGLESLMQYSQPLRPFQALSPLTTTLQVGTMYSRPAVKSPMAQLTSLKSTLRSRSTEGPEDETDGPSPAKLKVKPCRRQDLGTVPMIRKFPEDALQSHGARGTISAIFFGRKGGLM